MAFCTYRLARYQKVQCLKVIQGDCNDSVNSSLVTYTIIP